METRKVQRLGPSTVAMTLPAEWANEYDVEKGDEVSLRTGANGTMIVIPKSVDVTEATATITADELPSEAVERAIVAQYVLGRRTIRVERTDGVLEGPTIEAVYRAETQLMGLGVIEETPGGIAIRCSVDPEDFTLDTLLERLESTGATMRGEAVKALTRGDSQLAKRAVNRERQANKIFVLLLRLIFTAARNPNVARTVGLEEELSLIGYRAIAKNLELTADTAEDIAEIVLETGGEPLEVDAATTRRIREFTDRVDDLSELAVRSAVGLEFDGTVEARALFREIDDRESEILADLPEMGNDELLRVREVLVSLSQTAEYAMRNAEIGVNLSLDRESGYVSRIQ